MKNPRTLRYQMLLLVVALALATSLTQAQTYTDMHDFNGSDGCCAIYPSMLVQGQDGNIYGGTTSGGVGDGNIFMMTPSGTLTNLHNFNSTDGAFPEGGLSMGTDGVFYGTTYFGGTNRFGTIFKITSSGTFTSLYSFANTTDGAYPRTPPVQAQDGNLYGTTANGTIAVLYKLTPSGTFTVMVTLAAQSYSPLLLGTDGNLYGTTVYGGTFNAGTIFQYSPSTKKLKTLLNFQNEGSPYGPLMQGVDGNLYGTTSGGGTGSGGVVYKISTGGTGYKVLANFSTTNSANGDHPFAGLVQGSDKFLYGVCSAGGANGVGTLFKVSTTGTGLTVVHDFATTSGDTPYGTPLLHTNGKIYGIADHGGTHVSDGVFYSMDVGLLPFVETVDLHSAKSGASVQLLGQGFNTATKVLFGTGAGTFTINNDTFITAKIATGGTTGLITVDEPGGNLTTLPKFKVVPAIKTFTPTSGPVGTSVVITGTSLLQATAVKFGGVAATVFTVNSDTKVTATVPTGAVTGKISITTPGGTANSSAVFTVQ